MPEVEFDVPYMEFQVPEVKSGVPEFEFEVPEVKLGVPYVELGMPEFEFPVPKFEFEVPEVELGMPTFEFDVPYASDWGEYGAYRAGNLVWSVPAVVEQVAWMTDAAAGTYSRGPESALHASARA